MANILTRLRNLTKADDYEKTIPDIEREVATSQAELERLVASRGPAFFDLGEAEQKKLDEQIREAGERARNLELALSEAKKRRDAAAKKEFMAAVEHRMAEARETNKHLRDDYIEIHNLASALADRLRQAKERSIAIENANAFVVAAKRPDLKILPVIKALAKHLGVTTDMVSTGGSNYVHDPVREFVLPEYYPLESLKFGKCLAALKDVEV